MMGALPGPWDEDMERGYDHRSIDDDDCDQDVVEEEAPPRAHHSPSPPQEPAMQRDTDNEYDDAEPGEAISDVVHDTKRVPYAVLDDLLTRIRDGEDPWPHVVCISSGDDDSMHIVAAYLDDVEAGSSVRFAVGVSDEHEPIGVLADEAEAAVERIVALVATRSEAWEIKPQVFELPEPAEDADPDEDDPDEDEDEDANEEEDGDRDEEEDGDDEADQEEQAEEEEAEEDDDESTRVVAVVRLRRVA